MAITTQQIPEYLHWQVGIDISKEWLDCWLHPNQAYLRCDNSDVGFKQLHQWLISQGARSDSTVLCMENTGVYGKPLLQAMSEQGWLCAVEKTTVTGKVGPDHHRKDDRYDARLLAEYARRYLDQLHLHYPAERELELLRRLYAERRRMVRQRAATKTTQGQADQYPNQAPLLDQLWEQQRHFYDWQIQTLEYQMQQIVEGNAGLRHYYTLLQSIPGIGPVTGWLWLTLFYGQVILDPKKISSRYGFAPHSHRSGSSVRGKTRSSGHGVSEMRATMSLVARSVSTHYAKFKRYKHKKEQQKKCWPVIRKNLINKMILIICAIWNSNQPYDPNHLSRFDQQKKSLVT